ncbi:MAG: tRNA lysidine(34) synthetase TilS [Pseudomonadota bacterium]|nr:tRNA lysidine(34) synthetase TilS [Pseudomonadota bacterium]
MNAFNDGGSDAKLSPRQVFKGYNPAGIVTLAVSGGGDSVALLLLAHGWSQIAEVTLHAVTVDHGLRPEAAAEAAFVASLCEGLGIDHTTLGWEGLKPFSGVAEAARRARYNLIAEFATAIGSDLILTAPTADAQAETVFMRLMRETGMAAGEADAEGGREPVSLGRGMAGMSRLSMLAEGLMLGRPLLGTSRAGLRAYLASVPQGWVEDPTNEDTSYERVRVRKALAGDPLQRERLIRFSRVMGDMRAVLARDTARLLGESVSVLPGPVFQFEVGRGMPVARPVHIFALQVLVALAGGGEHLAPRGQVEPLLAWRARREPAKTTIGGAVIEKTGAGYRLYREMRNLESLDIEPGESLVWDGRLEITNNGRDAVHVGPLSRAGLERLERDRQDRIAAHPRAALISTALLRTGGKHALPMVESGVGSGAVACRVTSQAIEQFCPQSDFPVLDWLRELDAARRACLLPRP